MATQAARAGLTKYTGVTGTAPLRQAICDDLLRRKGTAYSPSEIVVSNGAKQVSLVGLPYSALTCCKCQQ
jgi:aspartate aminotransferase